MTPHVNYLLRMCSIQLRQLWCVRRSITNDAVKTLIHALISCRLDYCNSVMFEASASNIRKMQAVLNASARLITGFECFDHITPALRDELHWLPVLLVFKCLHDYSPDYLRDFYVPLFSLGLHRVLRSVNYGDIVQHRLQIHIGQCSFQFSAPAVWNNTRFYS